MTEEKMTEWQERVAKAVAEGAAVFQKNGLPITTMRHDGALLEHEHADHPDYKYPVEVEFVSAKPDTFHDQCVRKDRYPAHYGTCKLEWDHESGNAFCTTCNVPLSQAEQVHIQSYSIAEVEASMYESHDEALIYSDGAIAITLYECCYTMWSKRTDGGFLHGPDWSKKWKLTKEACEKIWRKT